MVPPGIPGSAVQSGIVAERTSPGILSPGWEMAPVAEPACTEEELLCAGACVNVTIDSEHCGGCGNVCPEGKHCQLGECVTKCPP